jgi:hypothetical protein
LSYGQGGIDADVRPLLELVDRYHAARGVERNRIGCFGESRYCVQRSIYVDLSAVAKAVCTDGERREKVVEVGARAVVVVIRLGCRADSPSLGVRVVSGRLGWYNLV